MVAEVEEVLGDKDEIEFDDLARLKYMGQVNFQFYFFHQLAFPQKPCQELFCKTLLLSYFKEFIRTYL